MKAAVLGLVASLAFSPQIAIAQAAAPTPPVSAEAELPSLAPMLKKVLPSVVSIAVQGTMEMEANPLYSDPFFRQFFDLPEGQPPTEQPFAGAGSGVIIDAAQGHLLTNNHVIRNADRITVGLSDGRQLPATLVGTDPETDIAVLKIPAQNLQAIEIGSSADLEVGDYVVAVGNPFGLQQTVTSGIVSALGRTGLGIEGYEDFIQIDAPINLGNSGGALVDLNGRLVGINTAIVGPSGANVGIGFAIPVDMALNVAAQLIEHGEMDRGRIGIQFQDLTPELATAFGAEGRTGALVSQVVDGSPADAAGILPGDIIISLDGQPFRQASDLRMRVGLMRSGTEITLGILRDGTEMSVTLTLEAPEGQPEPAPAAGVPGSPLAGVDLAPAPDGRGLVIQSVAPDSPAAAAGLRAGDVILSANRKDVATPGDLEAAIGAEPGPILLYVEREGNGRFVVVG